MLARSLCTALALALVVATAGAQTLPGHSPAAGSRAAETADVAALDAGAANAAASSAAPHTQAVPPVTRGHDLVEIAFSLGVLVFGAALIWLFTRTLLRLGEEWRTIYLRLGVLTVVVTAGLFALTACYTEQQISPMMGLLGTLVGYLLGRESSTSTSSKTQSSTPVQSK